MDLLAQMAMFTSVVEGRSLSAAARTQRLSLPAVSRQLRALEEDLGVTLIVRSTRRLRVTEAGQRWYERCVRVLRDVEEARASVRDDGAVRGRLVVSASFTFGMLEVIPRLAKLTERHPNLVVDLRLEDHLVNLVGEGVDIAIRAGSAPPDSTAYVAHPLSAMERWLVASPARLRKSGTPPAPEHLVRMPCLVQVTLGGVTVPWRLRRGDEERTVEVDGPLRSNAPLALRDLAVDGVGVAYLPDFVVAKDIEGKRLRRVLPEWTSPRLQAVAVHRAELRGAPRVRAFLEAFARTPKA
jgi:DNA-binding transcriptional LysR family regulator